MYNINVIITTFNRPEMLGRLLQKVAECNTGKLIVDIHNDGSTENYYPVLEKYFKYLSIRLYHHYHHGRKEYGSLINKVFANRAKAKYYIMLPDDDILAPDFFNRLIEKWESINDPDKICLMPSVNEERKWLPCWTPVIPKKVGNVYNAGFVDMRFICGDRFFKEVGSIEVDPKRWDKYPDLGSGVGSFISNRLNDRGLNMYISEEDLTHQVPHQSQMNPNQTDTRI